MVRLLGLLVILAGFTGCSKSNSTDDLKKEEEKLLNQPHTEEEAREAIKNYFVQSTPGKAVEVVSLSKPIEPSADYLAKHPGKTAYYAIVEFREDKIVIKRQAFVTVGRVTFAAHKGKLLLGDFHYDEASIQKVMGEAWLREHPAPWKDFPKK